MLLLSMVYPQKWQELLDRWEFYPINTIERISHRLENFSATNFIENLLSATARDLLNS